jgi:hypothetical protein
MVSIFIQVRHSMNGEGIKISNESKIAMPENKEL